MLGDDAKCTPQVTMPKDDDAQAGGHKGGKSLEKYKGDTVDSNGASIKPTNQSGGRGRGTGKPSGRGRTLVQTKELNCDYNSY